jgi:hypothetical protein
VHARHACGGWSQGSWVSMELRPCVVGQLCPDLFPEYRASKSVLEQRTVLWKVKGGRSSLSCCVERVFSGVFFSGYAFLHAHSSVQLTLNSQHSPRWFME